MAIKERVIMTEGVIGIADYGSSFDADARNFSVNMVVDTIYGSALEFAIMPAVAAAMSPNIQFEVVPSGSRIRRPTENVNVRRPPPPISREVTDGEWSPGSEHRSEWDNNPAL
jgi:hypothetical protein